MKDVVKLLLEPGFTALSWQMIVTWVVVGVLLYLAVYKQFEPLLLVPIAFGALLADQPMAHMINKPAGDLLSPVAGEVIYANAELDQKVPSHGWRSSGQPPSKTSAQRPNCAS